MVVESATANPNEVLVESRLETGISLVKPRQAADTSGATAAPGLSKALTWISPIVILCCAIAWSLPVRPQRVNPLHHSLSRAERGLGSVPAHISEFGPVFSTLGLPRCGNERPPEALLTPDPLLPAPDQSLLVRVSFIVGSDGHVYSAFVLNSAGPDDDRAVLRTVRQWRYRPALCNGVPTDFEARVRFSIP